MRRFGLDWLRILVVFLLFPFHTARVFDRWEPFYIKDTVNVFSSWFVAIIGFWIMALLFVIAGFSSFQALQKRTINQYIKERILRLRTPKEGHYSKVWLILFPFILMTAMEALPAMGGKNIFYYGLLFLFGFLIARSVGTMALVCRIRYGTLAAAILISPIYLFLADSLGWPGGLNLTAAGIALMRNLCIWLIVLALMGFADTYLNHNSALLSYLNGASYPVYIFHQSVMTIIAFFIVGTKLSVPVKYIAIMTGTLAVTLLLYEVFRRFAATRFILGIKVPSKNYSK